MGIEIEYPLGYASSGDTLFRETDFSTRQTTHLPIGPLFAWGRQFEENKKW